MNDKQVKEKMESLDALSGGIVFGKEDAWDKLQSRMDKKPARKISLWYRVAAAAAILLLSISIITVYNTPEKQIANNQTPNPVKQEIENVPATSIAITEPQPGIIVEQKKKIIKHEAQPIKFVITEKQPVVQPDPQETIPQPIVATVAPPIPAKPSIKKMRVVHINDHDNYEEPANAIAYTGPSLDIRKMKVVSIYDIKEEKVYQQAQEVITIVRINRPHGSLFSLANPLKTTGTYNHSFSQNPLTLKLNRNN